MFERQFQQIRQNLLVYLGLAVLQQLVCFILLVFYHFGSEVVGNRHKRGIVRTLFVRDIGGSLEAEGLLDDNL
jgi:hypothetical protein